MQFKQHQVSMFSSKYFGRLCLVMLMFACNSKKNFEEKSPIALCTSNASVSLEGIDNLPMPTFREKIGNSHLTITTQNKEAQRWFDQGLNHLHGFWHLEAYRAFREVIKLDANCAMGHWGLAMCQPGFGGSNALWLNEINKAVSLKSKVSAIENNLIASSEVLLKEGLNQNAVQKYKDLAKNHTDNPEAVAFAAIMLRQNENTLSEAQAMLEKALVRFPNYMALMHYYIHVMELRPDFEKAMPTAETLVKLAPNAPHLMHMPGHLYFLNGQYSKAVAVYEAARKQENIYHEQNKVPFIANQNYIHNTHFLAVAQAETGNEKAALKTAIELANLSLTSTIKNEGAALMHSYEGRILPALVHIRFQHWQEATEKLSAILNNLDNPIQNSMVRTYCEVMQLYTQAMQAVQNNQIQEASNLGGKLSGLMKQYEQQASNYQNNPEYKSINEVYDIMSIARYELAGWIDNIDKTKAFNNEAWQAAIDLQNAIKYDKPPRLMYPIEESLMKLHQYRGEIKAAKIAQKAALKRRPNSVLLL